MAAYADIFGGTVALAMRMSDGPSGMSVPEIRQTWIMHGEVRIGDSRLFLSDDVTGTPEPLAGSSVMMECPTAAGARAGFGTLTDRRGVLWMIGTSEAP